MFSRLFIILEIRSNVVQLTDGMLISILIKTGRPTKVKVPGSETEPLVSPTDTRYTIHVARLYGT